MLFSCPLNKKFVGISSVLLLLPLFSTFHQTGWEVVVVVGFGLLLQNVFLAFGWRIEEKVK